WAVRCLQHAPFVVFDETQVLAGLYSIVDRNRRIPETFVVATQPQEAFEKREWRLVRSTTRSHLQVAHEAVEAIRVAPDILGGPNALSPSFSQDGGNACY